MIGPKVTFRFSCHNCEFCKTESYTCQKDSGTNVFCGAMNNRVVGDTSWDTPDWCPYRDNAFAIALKKFREKE